MSWARRTGPFKQKAISVLRNTRHGFRHHYSHAGVLPLVTLAINSIPPRGWYAVRLLACREKFAGNRQF